MAIRTTTQQLESVQTAILAIEAGAQSYTIDNQTFTRASLPALYAREERLQARYNAEVRFNRPRVSYADLSGNEQSSELVSS